MKKLGKFSINPEKVIKNDELVNLRGGYGLDPMPCQICHNNDTGVVGSLWNPPQSVCDGSDYDLALNRCIVAFGSGGYSTWCTTCNP